MSGFHALVNRADIQPTFGKKRLDLQREFDQTFPIATKKKEDALKSLTEGYLNYKRSYVKHLLFNPDTPNLSEFIQHSSFKLDFLNHDSLPAATIEHAPLEFVYVFFDTATYDEIERDVKVSV